MKKYFWLALITFSAFFYYLNVNRLPDTPEEYYYWANLNYWLLITPLLVYLARGYKSEIYPFIGVTGFFLWLSFPLPVYFIRPESYQLSELSVEALEYCFWGYLTFFCSYFIWKQIKLFRPKPFDPIQTSIDNPQVRHLALFFLMVWAANRYIGITAIQHFATPGFYFFVGTYLLLLNYKVRISFFEKLLFIILLIVEYLQRAFDGLLAPLGLLTLFLAIIDFYSTRNARRLILFSIPFVLLFAVFSPVKHHFRRIVWYSEQDYTLTQRIEVLTELLAQKKQFESATEEKNDQEHFLWRYSYQASALSLVLRETPQNVPYWNGESYSILSKFVPRFLWPDKPRENMGYIFPTRYGVMSIYNRSTSMNTPILTEMYMNFGNAGVFIGMLCLAAIYALLNNYFNSIHISGIGKVYGVALTFPFVVQESNFSLVFGNLPLLIITVTLAIKLYIGSSSK